MAQPSFPVRALNLPELRAPLFAAGAVSLLDRPLVVIAGGRHPHWRVARLARSLARGIARAGLVVAAVASSVSGRIALTAAAAAGGATLGLFYDPLCAALSGRQSGGIGFGSGGAQAAGAWGAMALPGDVELWVSVASSRDDRHIGPDAADRALGTIASAVVVTDTFGLPDAFYIAEAALHAGRPIFLPGAGDWPSSTDRPGIHVGASVPTILDTLCALRR